MLIFFSNKNSVAQFEVSDASIQVSNNCSNPPSPVCPLDDRFLPDPSEPPRILDVYTWLFTLDENGCHTGPCEDEVAFLPVEQIPLSSEFDEPTVLVYPNPANNMVTFSFPPLEKDQLLNLFTGLGNKAKAIPLSKGIDHTTIDVRDLQTGVYYWQLANQTGKLIISR